MWIDESVLTQVSEAGLARRGRPRVYSDTAIQMLLGLKQVFHLPLRAVQGFALSLRELAYPGLPELHDLETSRTDPEGRTANAAPQ